ncbi:MAG TPA: hypothetical protein PK874_05955 [Desulfobacteraceae bacterium]|nr:hypothetical protein [Desulfobacteraceae bacterium]HPJ68489.1 hypothetical protein [Desulfobacteraceae bacterium]HPQ27247.1 hypothetical protein [Desulfobacteraceae bacterium]
MIVARAADKNVKDDDHDATGSCWVYPASVHADRINRTRDNLRYCKKHRIRLSGPSPRWGKPPKETPENAAHLRAEAIQAHQDELDRERGASAWEG